MLRKFILAVTLLGSIESLWFDREQKIETPEMIMDEGKNFKKCNAEQSGPSFSGEYTPSVESFIVENKAQKSKKQNAFPSSKNQRKQNHSESHSLSDLIGSSKTCEGCEHSMVKRGYSYSASSSRSNERKRISKGRKNRGKKHQYIKIRPRRHRHHKRKITILEKEDSSTYAHDVLRNGHCSAGNNRNFSGSASRSNSSRSINVKVKKDRKRGKKHTKREVIEGGRSEKKIRRSSSSSSISVSFSFSESSSYSNGYCEFERISVRKCKDGKCKIIKKCPQKRKNKKRDVSSSSHSTSSSY